MIDTGEFIEIKNDLVSIIDRRVVRQVALSDFMSSMGGGGSTTIPNIARSQVFAHYDTSNPREKILFAMTEIEPGIKKLVKNVNGQARRYKLAMPWTYLWFRCVTADERSWSFGEYRIFHARDKFRSIDDQMIVARLPNVYNNGNICWGSTGADANQSLPDRLDQLTNEWYASRFNTDLDGRVPLPYGETNYLRWVTESRADINSYRNWPEWRDPSVEKFSVRTLMEGEGYIPRTERIDIPDGIPPIEMPFTFGRWDEWWLDLDPQERTRAQISLANLGLDDPNNLPPIDAAATAAQDVLEDGGEIIT